MNNDPLLRRRKAFLTFNGCVALLIGTLAVSLPSTLIEQLKHADPSAAANVMARTVGVLIAAFGLLSLLVRSDPDSPTLRSVLLANLVLQLAIVPIDPLAYECGTFRTLGSFLPNTVLHLVLIAGFGYFLEKMRKNSGAARSAATSSHVAVPE